MSETPLRTGKLPAALLRSLLEASARPSPELRVGPLIGEDACVIEVPAGALIVGTDPVTLTSEQVGGHAVLINANDVAVMGAAPRWFLAAVLLPTGTTEKTVRNIFAGMREQLESVGAVLVGGHTEVTSAVCQPLVVGQMLGIREDGHYIPTGGLRNGDLIVQVGAAPIEGTAILAEKASTQRTPLAPGLLEEAQQLFDDPGICVVEPALECARLGATALHDPTEGGLSAGLHELAEASGVRLEIRREAVLWLPAGLSLCRALDLDIWGMLASGTVLAGFGSDAAESALEELKALGFAVAKIGRAQPGQGVLDENGAPLPRHERDELSRYLES